MEKLSFKVDINTESAEASLDVMAKKLQTFATIMDKGFQFMVRAGEVGALAPLFTKLEKLLQFGKQPMKLTVDVGSTALADKTFDAVSQLSRFDGKSVKASMDLETSQALLAMKELKGETQSYDNVFEVIESKAMASFERTLELAGKVFGMLGEKGEEFAKKTGAGMATTFMVGGSMATAAAGAGIGLLFLLQELGEKTIDIVVEDFKFSKQQQEEYESAMAAYYQGRIEYCMSLSEMFDYL